MNPRNLFSLTDSQRQKYLIQPDEFPGYNWYESFDEYERPPYMEQSTIRFWYNTQNIGFTTHWHNAVELIVPLEECYQVTVRSQKYQLEPGDIFLISPGELHSLEAPSAGARFIFLFELDFLSQLRDFSLTRSCLTRPIHLTSDACPGLYKKEISLIMDIAAFYWGDSPARQMHIYACLMEFFAFYTDHCLQKIPLLPQNTGSISREQTAQNLNFILQYMEQHYSEKISLEEAASMTRLSKFYFTRIFRQYTGTTFYNYLNTLRIQASEELLKDTSTPVSRISASCGFTSVSSFSRCFHRVRGCSPSEFRSLYRHEK